MYISWIINQNHLDQAGNISTLRNLADLCELYSSLKLSHKENRYQDMDSYFEQEIDFYFSFIFTGAIYNAV